MPITFLVTMIILRLIILFVGDYVYVGGVRHITEDYLASFVYFPVAGVTIGLLQYALLRRYLARMGWWVAATVGGWLVGQLVLMTPGWLHWDSQLATFDMALIAMGACIGAGQWLLLRRRLPNAGWWIAANVAGWSLLTLISVGNGLGMFSLWIVGVVPACATAVALARLMNQDRRVEAQGAEDCGDIREKTRI